MLGRKVQALEWRAAVESVVAPLVRALRGQGMTNAEIAALLGDVARRTGDESGSTDAAALASPALSYAAATRLLGRWRSDPLFSDDGVPRPLPVKGARSFEALARATRVSASEARAALRRLGLIRMTAGRVVLRVDAYVPARGVTEKLDILGRDGAEFVRTMLHNVKASPGQAFLQRKTCYDNIGGDSAQQTLTALRRHGTEALMSADAMLARVDRDRNPSARGGRRTRISFGVYCISESVSSGTGARTNRRARRRRES